MSTCDDILDALEQLEPGPISGMVEWMHFGLALRDVLDRNDAPRQQEWLALDATVGAATDAAMARIVPLVEARAWAAGAAGARLVAEAAWPRLSPLARGCVLAGMARHLEPATTDEARSGLARSGRWLEASEPIDIGEWTERRLAHAMLDASSAAEIGVNAVRTGRNGLLLGIVSLSDLRNAAVPRLTGRPHQRHFEEQLSRQPTRLLDVLLEAAVRTCRPEAARLLLERGANPNIPCWLLERSFQQHFSALSFCIHGPSHGAAPSATWRELVELLLAFGADPQGLECEGKNFPLMSAPHDHDWDLADRLLALGARFEGGLPHVRSGRRPQGMPAIAARDPVIAHPRSQIDWVQSVMGPLVPLAEPREVPPFHFDNVQGGRHLTFLHALLADHCMPLIDKYEAAGLRTALTPHLVLDIIRWRRHAALARLLRAHPALPEVMARTGARPRSLDPCPRRGARDNARGAGQLRRGRDDCLGMAGRPTPARAGSGSIDVTRCQDGAMEALIR